MFLFLTWESKLRRVYFQIFVFVLFFILIGRDWNGLLSVFCFRVYITDIFCLTNFIVRYIVSSDFIGLRILCLNQSLLWYILKRLFYFLIIAWFWFKRSAIKDICSCVLSARSITNVQSWKSWPLINGNGPVLVGVSLSGPWLPPSGILCGRRNILLLFSPSGAVVAYTNVSFTAIERRWVFFRLSRATILTTTSSRPLISVLNYLLIVLFKTQALPAD